MTTNGMKVSVKSNLDLTGAQIEILRDSTAYGIVTFCVNSNRWKIDFKYGTTIELAKRYLKEIAISGKDVGQDKVDHYIDTLSLGNGNFVNVSDEHFTYAIHGRGGNNDTGFAFLDPIK